MRSAREGRKGAAEIKPSIIKIVLLGNGNVGKSSLMTRFVNDTFDDKYYCTLGVDFLNKEIDIDSRKFCIQIWDTAGQERFKCLRTPFYRGSDICLLTYSINDRESFEQLSMWKNEFMRYARFKTYDSFPFVVIGNKCDLPPEERQVSTEEAESWCKEQGFPFIEASAKEAINVEETFHLALRNWLKNEESLPDIYAGDTVNLNVVTTHKRERCC